jgi:hypothetical protein
VSQAKTTGQITVDFTKAGQLVQKGIKCKTFVINPFARVKSVVDYICTTFGMTSNKYTFITKRGFVLSHGEGN